MGRIVSLHDYMLRPDVVPAEFEEAIRAARSRGVLALPGLDHPYLLKGLRGRRRDKYAAVWVYESLDAWENLWGPLAKPRGRDRYPRNWRIWEDEVLEPYLAEEPDKIVYTAYAEV